MFEVLENKDVFVRQKEIRRNLCDEFFSYKDGKSAERAAKIIYDHIEGRVSKEDNFYRLNLLNKIKDER
ncbi:hypothetical protein [Caldicellulosiruptor owensensis]|uniref:hypothetical protein n=1 Tax=Caldicellulosiruptor owensensis TaxID=55205 RepID=UPI0002DA3AF3|nr:hypothetical protein [Caldicellulosiruptor owensensis]